MVRLLRRCPVKQIQEDPAFERLVTYILSESAELLTMYRKSTMAFHYKGYEITILGNTVTLTAMTANGPLKMIVVRGTTGMLGKAWVSHILSTPPFNTTLDRAEAVFDEIRDKLVMLLAEKIKDKPAEFILKEDWGVYTYRGRIVRLHVKGPGFEITGAQDGSPLKATIEVDGKTYRLFASWRSQGDITGVDEVVENGFTTDIKELRIPRGHPIVKFLRVTATDSSIDADSIPITQYVG